MDHGSGCIGPGSEQPIADDCRSTEILARAGGNIVSHEDRYDVAIVGARCAGAALATFLARSGARVLVVDRDPLPSDQVLSTHTIHPPGVDILDELGVGDAVRSVTPESPTIRLRKGDAWVDTTFPDGRHELCPRRERLDGLLQSAAAEAGVELRDRTRVTSVVFNDEGRAIGIEVQHRSSREKLWANLVVGADGRRSSVAAEVGAEKYMAYDAPRAMYWAYWDAPPIWKSDAFPFDMYVGAVGADIRIIFQTDHDQLLIGSLPSVEEARSWRGDPLASLKSNLAAGPVTAPLIGTADPASSVRGTVKEEYFFREGAGSGWALVGDAGYHKEFVVGDGITEALIQAKNLAEACAEGTDVALIRWWRARDLRALPGYFWGRDEGSLDPPAQLESLIFARVAEDDVLRRSITRLPEHEASPYDVLPMSVVLSSFFGALIRGRFGVIPEFLAQGRRVAEYKKELVKRKRMLEEAAVGTRA